MAKMVTKDSPTDCHSEMREASDFINMLKKKESVAKGFSNHISTLHRSVRKGKLVNFINCLKTIPAEALFLIKGLEIEELKVNPFPGQTDEIKIDTTNMSILELVCVLGHNSLLQYLLKEL